MDLSKAKYILPNLFTLSSVFAGFYAMVVTANAETTTHLTMAAWLIGVSLVLDGCDGRVARATKTQSEFGVQLDSLADAVAFGIAPAFLVYRWGLEPLGTLGLVIAFVFGACGIMRLARFNVLASQPSEGPSTHFLGLPIPLAAGTLVAIILAHVSMTGKMQSSAHWSVACFTLLLAGLMVSNVRYRTFKKVRLRGPKLILLLLVVAGAIFASIRFNPGLAFASVFSAYILFGLTESVIGLRKRLPRRHHIEDEEVEPEEQESL